MVCPLETVSLLFGKSAKPLSPSLRLSREITPMMPKELKEILRAFNDHGVKYLVVGGYAYGVHAEPRATKDLDIFIRSDEENSQAVFRALAQFGAPLDGLSPADFMDGSTFQIGQPPTRVDLLQHIDGITFDQAWKNRIEGLIEGEIRIMVISKNDLIRNKLASGREQDILDVKKLRTAAPEDT
jgi:predicted nucleotidyltransferase